MTFKTFINSLFSNPIAVFMSITAISAFSLGAALFAEAILLLEPCRLCIYQRYPFGIAILIGIMGYFFRKDIGTARILLTLCALLFATNSAVAFYHTGVEQKWWESAVEGCKVSFENSNNDVKSMLANIMSEPTSSCENIPWSDPILGLSMANYNIGWSFILALYCAVAAMRIRKFPTI
jgi:disulfide bond formation protein DsbB